MTPAALDAAPPILTVVTVVFNGAAEIARTIDSVLTQTYTGIEYIVIDGGSSDGTPEIVRAYGAAISSFVSEPDRGVYDAMNKGAALARGDYLLFMNCGDVFVAPQTVALVMPSATHEQREVLFGGWLRRQAEGRHQPCVPRLAEGIFNHQAVIYSRALHAAHGGYASVRGFTTADYLFFSSLLASGTVACKRVDVPIALIDVQGMSAGPQSLSQKLAIDFLHGRSGRLRLIAVLALHPLKVRLKRWLSGPT